MKPLPRAEKRYRKWFINGALLKFHYPISLTRLQQLLDTDDFRPCTLITNVKGSRLVPVYYE
jgi:hypothetical protein